MKIMKISGANINFGYYAVLDTGEKCVVEESGYAVDQCWWTYCSRLCSPSQQPNIQAIKLNPDTIQ